MSPAALHGVGGVIGDYSKGKSVMNFTFRSTCLAGLVAASCLIAGTASAATLVGDEIAGYAIFPNKSTTEPAASTAAPVTVTDDDTDSFGFGFGNRFSVDVNALSVTVTYNFTSTAFPVGTDCNCLLLAGLNFSDASTLTALSIDAATGGFSAFSLGSDAEFGTNALTSFAFPAGPVSTLLAGSDTENGEFVLIDVGGLNLASNDTLTLGFATTSTPPSSPVPLPASALFLIASLGGLVGLRRRARL